MFNGNQNNNPINIFQSLLTLGNNPEQIQQILFMRNPQLQVIYNQMKQSNLNPIQFAMQFAKQNNIPIQENVITQQYQTIMNMVSQSKNK